MRHDPKKLYEDILQAIDELEVFCHHVLAHGYDTLEHEILWDVVVKKLPPLRCEIERLL